MATYSHMHPAYPNSGLGKTSLPVGDAGLLSGGIFSASASSLKFPDSNKAWELDIFAGASQAPLALDSSSASIRPAARGHRRALSDTWATLHVAEDGSAGRNLPFGDVNPYSAFERPDGKYHWQGPSPDGQHPGNAPLALISLASEAQAAGSTQHHHQQPGNRVLRDNELSNVGVGVKPPSGRSAPPVGSATSNRKRDAAVLPGTIPGDKYDPNQPRAASFTPALPAVLEADNSDNFDDFDGDVDELTRSHSGQSADDSKERKDSKLKRGGCNGRTQQELLMLDPKRVKRILANRQSAARSKTRRMAYTHELESKLSSMHLEVDNVGQEVAGLTADNGLLGTANTQLRQQAEQLQEHIRRVSTENQALLERLHALQRSLNLPESSPALGLQQLQPPAGTGPPLPPALAAIVANVQQHARLPLCALPPGEVEIKMEQLDTVTGMEQDGTQYTVQPTTPAAPQLRQPMGVFPMPQAQPGQQLQPQQQQLQQQVQLQPQQLRQQQQMQQQQPQQQPPPPLQLPGLPALPPAAQSAFLLLTQGRQGALQGTASLFDMSRDRPSLPPAQLAHSASETVTAQPSSAARPPAPSFGGSSRGQQHSSAAAPPDLCNMADRPVPVPPGSERRHSESAVPTSARNRSNDRTDATSKPPSYHHHHASLNMLPVPSFVDRRRAATVTTGLNFGAVGRHQPPTDLAAETRLLAFEDASSLYMDLA